MNKTTTLLIGAGALIALALIASTATASAERPGRHYDRVGRVVHTLPASRARVVVRDRDYYYHRGVFYAPRASRYVVISAPIGARVNSLPAGYLTFGIGSSRYFYVNSTYYRRDGRSQDYIVVRKPDGADEAVAAAEEIADVAVADLVIYPSSGQSEAERDQDRYECHLWAKEQTRFDPSAPNQDRALASDYNRAISACLEGRGYTVR